MLINFAIDVFYILIDPARSVPTSSITDGHAKQTSRPTVRFANGKRLGSCQPPSQMRALRVAFGDPGEKSGRRWQEALIVTAMVVILAIIGPLISPHDPVGYTHLRARFQPPGYADSKGAYVLGS